MKNIPLSTMRKIIAENMAKSKRNIPHFYLTTEVDMTECVNLRAKFNEELQKKDNPKCTFDDFIIKATAMSLKKNPRINCKLTEDSIQIIDAINIGLAVSLEDGLIVPVIYSAGKLSLEEIISRRDDLVNRARSKKLNPDETKGAQIIISNLGMYEIKNFTAIIPPTASSILAIGKIKEKPIAKDGKVIIRSMMNITGSFDHRVIDGVYAAPFLEEIKNLLEQPRELID
jgi:pyruvate dehydrogenase E2 component (dihydrolipoamide acetyltransferase)